MQQQMRQPVQQPMQPAPLAQQRQYGRKSSDVSPGSSVSQIPPYGVQYGAPPAGSYAPVQQPFQQQPMPMSQQPIVMQPSHAPSSSSSGFVRKRTVRQIPLTPQGNLVIDVPVADRVAKMGKYASGDEFTHMRYTAATCSPDDFASKGYSLRQQELRRSTELFIVVTMYNEDDYLFCKSMQALMKNIAYLCSRTRSKVWGEEGWKKAVICIVSDGRAKVNARVLDVMGIMGVYQNGIMKDHVNGKPVTAHIFEYTTQVCVTPDLKVHGHEKGYVPVQILFCLKEKNAKKINSHRWFFNAFGPLIRPEVTILIDVGTKPTPTSLYHLWK
ncbi:Chitin synthase, class 1, partial [Kappamyces sp. JEL0680]